MSELVLENNCIVPNNWKLTNVEELLKKLESGSRPKGGVQSIKNGIPSIGGEHLNNNGDFRFEKIKFIPKEFYNSMTTGRIQKNDILIVKDGATTGKTSFISMNFPYEKSAVNEHVFIVRTFENFISPKFLFYFFCSPYGQQIIKSRITGTAQGGINTSFVKKFSILIPPTNEQKRIVEKIEELFSKLHNAKTILEKNKLQLKQYRGSLLKSAFNGKLTEKWREENKVKAKIQKKDHLPEGWAWRKTGEVCKGIVPGRYKPKIFDGDIPWITTPDLDGLYISKSKKNLCVTNTEAARVGMKIMPKGTVLITCVGDLGKICITKNDVVPNQQFHGFVCTEMVLPEYLAFALTIQIRQMINSSTSTVISYMNKTTCNNLKIPLALSLNEQKEIISQLELGFSLIENTENITNSMLKQLETLRSCIIKQAFEGKLVPQDPNDEPAEILLQKIKQEKEQLKQKEKSQKRKKNAR